MSKKFTPGISIIVSSTVLLLFSLGSSSASGQELSEQDVNRAEIFLQDLLETGRLILIDDSRNEEAKIELLKVTMEQFIDFKNISRIVMGPSYRELSTEQITDYQELFRDYLTTVLALRLKIFPNPSFRLIDSKMKGKHLLVSFQASDLDQSIAMDWLLTNIDNEQPKVMDVIINGSSMLVAQRAEITQVHRSQGLSGVLEFLDQIARQR